MLRRIGGMSGLFVLLAFLWYLVFPSMTACTDMATGVENEECREFITPIMSFFCALPPLIIAVLVFVSNHGAKPKVLLQSPLVDAEGKMHLQAGVEEFEESSKQTQLAQSGMKIGAVLVVGSYGLNLVAGMLVLLLAILCGMSMGNNCGDDSIETFLSWISLGNLGINLGLVVFLVSAIAKLVIEYQLETTGMSTQTKPAVAADTKVKSPCPACGATLRFPVEYQGQVQCPKCDHVFVVGMK